jgi:hypothetical protein
MFAVEDLLILAIFVWTVYEVRRWVKRGGLRSLSGPGERA